MAYSYTGGFRWHGGKESACQCRRCKRGWFNPLEEEMATTYGILAWRIPWTKILGGYSQSKGSQRVRQDRVTGSHTYLFNGILVSHRKEWNTYTCCNLDEPQKHYAKLNKPVTETTYCMTAFIGKSGIGKYTETQSRIMVAKSWSGDGRTWGW